MNKKLLISLTVAVLLITSCSGNKKEEVTKAVDPKIAELQELLTTDSDNLVIVEELLSTYFNNSMAEEYLELFEANKNDFTNNVTQRVNFASAQCMMADGTTNVMNQLSWVKKGMTSFDNAVEDFPNEKLVYLYRGITYSNFPAILGVKDVVLQDFKTLKEKAESGDWNLEIRDLITIYYGYLNLSVNFKDADLFTTSYSSLKRDLTDTTLPVFEAYEQNKKDFR